MNQVQFSIIILGKLTLNLIHAVQSHLAFGVDFPDSGFKANTYLSSIWISLSARLRRSWGYQWCQQSTSMRFQALRSCARVRISWARGADFLDWLALQHIRGIEFCVHQVLVYHVWGGTEHISYFGWMDFRVYGLSYLVVTLSLLGVARLFPRGIGEFTKVQERIKLLSWPNWTDAWIYERERRYSW